MPLRGINVAAYRGARVPEGTALTAPRHSAYLPVSRQMPKCPFGTLREPGRPETVIVGNKLRRKISCFK